jgi:exonuclease III
LFNDDDIAYFAPTELNETNDDLLTEFCDPDTHFYNEVSDYTKNNSKYHTSDSFNNLIASSSLEMSLISMNIRSAPKNLDDFLYFLKTLQHEFCFVGLVETWFSDNNIDLYPIDGYKHEYIHRKDRRGGGASLFVKNDIDYIVRNDLTEMTTSRECIFIEVNKRVFQTDNNVVIGVLYRIPNTDIKSFNDYIDKLYVNINREKKILYLMGDTNINLLNTDSHNGTSEFVDINFSHLVLPLINRPTRITDTSSTLIDNIFTNNVTTEKFTGILLTGITDHLPVFMIEKQFKLQRNKCPSFIFKRIYNEINNENYMEMIRNTDFTSVLNSDEAQSAFTKFHTLISYCYNKSFPLTRLKVNYKNRKPWLTEGLKKCIKRKNNLYAKQLKYKNTENVERYRKYRNKLNHLLRIEEKNIYPHY